MYIPAANAVTDPDELAAMLGGLRLGCLVTHGAEGLYASHLPMLHDAGRGVLAGHLARANPHGAHSPDGTPGLAIFQGPEAYVSPSWYPSKAEHGRVVPTWNYEVVHIHGRLTWRDEEGWLQAHLAALADHFEAGRPEPWAVSDAPEDYLQGLRRGIVGLELAIDRVEAKRKLSQNRPEAERAGVIAGLASSLDLRDQEVAAAMQVQAAKPPF